MSGRLCDMLSALVVATVLLSAAASTAEPDEALTPAGGAYPPRPTIAEHVYASDGYLVIERINQNADIGFDTTETHFYSAQPVLLVAT